MTTLTLDELSYRMRERLASGPARRPTSSHDQFQAGNEFETVQSEPEQVHAEWWRRPVNNPARAKPGVDRS